MGKHLARAKNLCLVKIPLPRFVSRQSLTLFLIDLGMIIRFLKFMPTFDSLRWL